MLMYPPASCLNRWMSQITELIYGGVQKNVGPAGVVIAIIREDLITDDVLTGNTNHVKVENTGRYMIPFTIHHHATVFISAAKYSNG